MRRGVGLAALVLAGLVPALGCGGHPAPLPRTPGVGTQRPGGPAPLAGRVTARIHLHHAPTGVSFGRGALWVTGDDATLERIDPATNRVAQISTVGRWPLQVAFEPHALWVVNSDDNTVSHVDARTGRVVGAVRVGELPVGAATANGTLWVASGFDPTVSRLDTRLGRVVATIVVGDRPSNQRALALGEGAVWVTAHESVVRIDPATNRVVQRIHLRSPSGAAAGHGAVWISNADDDTVTRIDPVSGRIVDRIAVGRNPMAIALAHGSVWVVNNADGTVTQIDAATDDVVATIPVAVRAFDITAGAGAVWVQSYGDKTIYRIEPRRAEGI